MGRKEIIKNIRLYLFDMDGTLYLGDRLFDFSKELLKKIRQSGADYLFMTNNSSKSVSAYIEKLERLGIKAVKEDFITSSQATAYYLKKHHPNAQLYVCGTQSLFCYYPSLDDMPQGVWANIDYDYSKIYTLSVTPQDVWYNSGKTVTYYF